MPPTCRFCGQYFQDCACHDGPAPQAVPVVDSDRWRRDRHDRRAVHTSRDALITMRRAVGRRDDIPSVDGMYTAALTSGPHFMALNVAARTLEEALAELSEGFGVLLQCSGNEWALAQHYGWYVIVYSPQAQAVAA